MWICLALAPLALLFTLYGLSFLAGLAGPILETWHCRRSRQT